MNPADQEALFASSLAAVRVPRDVIHAAGPEAQDFLQGQLSQDVAVLAPGASAWSLLLQPQGKVTAWLRVSRMGPDEFVLDVDAGFSQTVLDRLNRFKLRTKITFEELAWDMVAVRGPNVADHTFQATISADPQWPGVAGVDLLGEQVTLPDDLVLVEPNALEVLRILSGVPAMGAELHEDVIPAEAGIVDRSASFTKGCYTGQELVARIDSRGGNVPKRLRLLRSQQPFQVGQDVLVDDAVVGSVTSAAFSAAQNVHVGLAYVKRSVDTTNGPITGQVGQNPMEIRSIPV